MIGSMRHRITIRPRSEAADAYGGAAVTFAAGTEVWAAVQYKSIAGGVGPGGQIADRTQVDFVIRQEAYSTARQGWRIDFDSRTFLIDAVANEDERGRFLRLVAQEQEFGT